MTGALHFVPWITREMVRSHPDARFVFGDNVARVAFGGQAASMRGEPNAIGVATKRRPGNRTEDFFQDEAVDDLSVINADIDLVADALADGRTVYAPKDGLGTGLSELPTRAPKLHQHIIDRFRALAGDDFPWGRH